MAAGVKGNVIAEVVIDPGGDVIDAKIFRSILMLDTRPSQPSAIGTSSRPWSTASLCPCGCS
jgi:hypothetical protein